MGHLSTSTTYEEQPCGSRIRDCVDVPELPEELVAPRSSQACSWRERTIRCLDPRQWIRTIVKLDDTPHSLALGTAIGVFIGITPTGGVQMALVMLTALITRPFFRFNRIAALLGVYISNPITTIPLCWYSYRIGTFFFPKEISWSEFLRLFTEAEWSNWWVTLKAFFFAIGPPLIVGSIVLGAIIGALSYPLIYVLAVRVQRLRHNEDQCCLPMTPESVSMALIPQTSDFSAEECA